MSTIDSNAQVIEHGSTQTVDAAILHGFLALISIGWMIYSFARASRLKRARGSLLLWLTGVSWSIALLEEIAMAVYSAGLMQCKVPWKFLRVGLAEPDVCFVYYFWVISDYATVMGIGLFVIITLSRFIQISSALSNAASLWILRTACTLVVSTMIFKVVAITIAAPYTVDWAQDPSTCLDFPQCAGVITDLPTYAVFALIELSSGTIGFYTIYNIMANVSRTTQSVWKSADQPNVRVLQTKVRRFVFIATTVLGINIVVISLYAAMFFGVFQGFSLLPIAVQLGYVGCFERAFFTCEMVAIEAISRAISVYRTSSDLGSNSQIRMPELLVSGSSIQHKALIVAGNTTSFKSSRSPLKLGTLQRILD